MSETEGAAEADANAAAAAAAAEEAPKAPEAPAPAPEPEVPAEPEPAKDTAPGKEDWRETRIRQLTARLHAVEAEAKKVPQQPVPAAPAPADAAPAQDDMERRIAEELSRREFANACNATYDAGKGKYPDFDDAVKAFGMMGGAPQPFLEAVTALDHSAEVFYALGKDPAAAMKVLQLPPVKMAVELARIEAKLTAAPPPKPVSKAPAPVTPLGGAVSDPLPDLDDTSDGARWIAEREKQAAANPRRVFRR